MNFSRRELLKIRTIAIIFGGVYRITVIGEGTITFG